MFDQLLKYVLEKFEAYINKFEVSNHIDEVRQKVSSTCREFASHKKGLYQLTVPTGGGKTLASLRFALHHARQHQMDRIIYIAPYTSIIDQNAQEARAIFEANNSSSKQIVLEHHSNLTPEEDTWQSRILSENWDAPIVFTTAVQLLETLFGAGTRGVRKMHQLANSVIIFDEAQTIPVKAIHLFNNALNFLVQLCGSTIVLCTATQPLLDRVDAGKGAARLTLNSQMMPDVKSLFADLRRVDIIDKRKPGGWAENEVADLVLQEMANISSILVIVNTKSQARELYNLLRKRRPHVYHLSTKMCPAHRMDILRMVKKRLRRDNPKPVICISTSLIESGINVDFELVIRYVAGIDSIAQAAGRCNRDGLRPSGRVFIVNPSRENLDKLPDIRKAKEIAKRILDEFHSNPEMFDNDLQSPAAIELYYHYYFFERANEMSYPVASEEIGVDDTLLSLLSTNKHAVDAYRRINKTDPPILLRQSFATSGRAFKAIDSPTEGVIVPYREGKQIIAELMAASQSDNKSDLLKLAQRYSVNIFPYEMQKLKAMGSIREVLPESGIMYLDSEHYSRKFGISIKQVNQMETLIV